MATERHRGSAPPDGGDKEPKPFDIARGVTPETLRQKARSGSPLTIFELILVDCRHTLAYYRKNGEVTRHGCRVHYNLNPS